MSLDRLLGTWDITMHHDAMTDPVSGRQQYERVLDGAFLRLTWTYDHPDFPDALAVLSEEAMHYFDVRGVVRVFELDVHEGGWTAQHLDPEFAQRFEARFVGADLIETEGYVSADGGATWAHDFTMSAARAD